MHEAAVRAYVRRLLPSRADAEDVMAIWNRALTERELRELVEAGRQNVLKLE